MMFKRIKKSWRRFSRAKEGLAALEFALLAPLMIMLLLTSIELINLLQTNRRVENTAASLADVISRDTEISNSELTGLWTAVEQLLYPSNYVGVDLRIVSISIQSDGTGRVAWSEVCGIDAGGYCGDSTFTPLTSGSTVQSSDLPATNTPGSSLIRVDIAYDYSPILGFYSTNSVFDLSRDTSGVHLERSVFRRSRLVDPIPRTS